MTDESNKLTYTETVARFDERQKAMRDDIKEIKEDAREFHKDINGRVRALEKWRNYLVGGVIVAGAVGLPEGVQWLAALLSR
jgi:hypothetical protein